MEERDPERDEGPTTDAEARPLEEDPIPTRGEALSVGAEIAGYRIDGQLGKGGMGTVYAATHPVIGKRAAIKVLKPSLSKNPASVERFSREARAVNQIRHPNIIDVFAFGTLPDGRYYFMMDLLEGETLRTRVKRGAIPVDDTRYILTEIASALAAAHGKGFVHRDLKPDNIFLVARQTTRFEVRLLDFGVAKLLPNAVDARAFRTATGAQLGTPDYMSPEQLRGSNVDDRTDIHALGVMAVELLTGKRPKRFHDGSFEFANGLVPTLLTVPRVTDELAQLIAAMLATSPDERPTLQAIRAVLARRPGDRPMTAPPATRPLDPAQSVSASMFGARPVLPTPPTGAPVVASGPPGSAPAAIAAPASGPRPLPSPSAPPQSYGLAANAPSGPQKATTFGVPPPPASPARTPYAPGALPPSGPHSIDPGHARPSVPAGAASSVPTQSTRSSRVWAVLAFAVAIVAGAAAIYAVTR